jgi:hypothetical protein
MRLRFIYLCIMFILTALSAQTIIASNHRMDNELKRIYFDLRQNVHTCSGAHPSLLSSVYRISFLGIKAAAA